MTRPSLTDLLARFGRFRVLYSSTIQFNSLCFRLVTGVLVMRLAEFVAIVTATEFLLNALLEVPLGVVADRYGRVRSALIGLFLFAASLFLTFYYLIGEFNPQMSYALAIAVGGLIGIGKPLVSGSTEGFYQENIDAYKNESAENKSLVENSFVLSLSKKKYVPALYIISAVALLFAFNYLGHLPAVFLVGGTLYIVLMGFLYRDARIYRDQSREDRLEKSKFDFWKMIKDPITRYSTLLRTQNMFFLVIVLGYHILAIGRAFPAATPNEKILLSLAQMLGYMGLGWWLRGLVGPYLVSRIKKPLLVPACLLGLFATALAGFLIIDKLSLFQTCVFLFIFMASFQVFSALIDDTAINLLLSRTQPSHYTTALSVQNIFPFLLVVVISQWFALAWDGSPTPKFSYLLIMIAASIGLLLLPLARPKNAS